MGVEDQLVAGGAVRKCQAGPCGCHVPDNRSRRMYYVSKIRPSPRRDWGVQPCDDVCEEIIAGVATADARERVRRQRDLVEADLYLLEGLVRGATSLVVSSSVRCRCSRAQWGWACPPLHLLCCQGARDRPLPGSLSRLPARCDRGGLEGSAEEVYPRHVQDRQGESQ